MPSAVSTISALVLCCLRPAAAQTDPYAVIRARARAQFYPAAASLPSLIAAANHSLTLLNASCFFTDVNYADQTRANWGAIPHLYRVAALAQATTTPGSPAFEDAHLLSGMHCALQAWLGCSPRLNNPNWWYRWIGEELSLQSTFLLLGSNRTTALEFQKLVEFSYSSAWWVNDYGGGDNLSDMLRIQLWRGIASANATAVQQAFDVLFSTAKVGHVTDAYEGVIDDMSYHFHGIQMLSSAYGAGWVATMLDTLATAAGTRWAMPDAAAGVLAQFLAEGDLAITFGRRWDFGTQGRGIDRPGLNFGWGWSGDSLRQLAAAPAAQPWGDALAHFASLLDGVQPAQQRSSSRHFWTTDFHAHKRPTWGASFKAYGNNSLWTVVGNECDNSENILGEYTGAGVLNVYPSAELDGALEAYGSIFPLWDWVRINGVTAEARAPVVCDSARSSDWVVENTAYVGGASDGASGAVAHDFRLHALSGLRSFFFFDDAVVALASNLINAPSALPVRTALVSRLLPAPASDARGRLALGFANGTTLPSLPDGNHSFGAGELAWLNAGGLGVLLPGGAAALPVDIELGTATGDYRTIGPFSGRVQGRLLTATYAHGAGLRGGASAYTLAPNATAADMPARAASGSGVACSGSSSGAGGALHVAVAVAAGGDVVVGAVAWGRGGGAYAGCAAASGSGSFSVDGDAILLLRYNASHVTATVAHPGAWAAGAARAVGQARQLRSAPGCDGDTLALRLPAAGPFMGSSVAQVCELA